MGGTSDMDIEKQEGMTEEERRAYERDLYWLDRAEATDAMKEEVDELAKILKETKRMMHASGICLDILKSQIEEMFQITITPTGDVKDGRK